MTSRIDAEEPGNRAAGGPGNHAAGQPCCRATMSPGMIPARVARLGTRIGKRHFFPKNARTGNYRQASGTVSRGPERTCDDEFFSPGPWIPQVLSAQSLTTRKTTPLTAPETPIYGGNVPSQVSTGKGLTAKTRPELFAFRPENRDINSQTLISQPLTTTPNAQIDPSQGPINGAAPSSEIVWRDRLTSILRTQRK